MSNIKMFRTISGEDVIAEIIDSEEEFLNCKNIIQLMLIPSKANPQEVNYGFAPYPQYARPKSEAIVSFNKNNIVFFVDIDEDFLEQYNAVFNNIVAPSAKIIL